jgi:hypothetical protein
MTEESRNRIELFIKAIGPLLVLAGLVFGVIQFQTTAELDREARENQYIQTLEEAQREAKKPFYEEQLALYLEATNVTSRIAVPLNEDDKRRAIVRFWQLYWGQLALVESPEVASAMVAFKEVLQDTSLSEEIREKELKKHTINLARKCRDSLRESWNVELLEIRKS